MFKIMKSIITLFSLAAALTSLAQEVTYYSWDFSEAAGSGVFAEVTNSGSGSGSYGEWLGYVTDGNGNWVVDGNVSTENKYATLNMFPQGMGVTDGVWVATLSLKGWELASAANSSLIVGFTDSEGTHLQAKLANGGTQLRIAAVTFIGNFGNDSHSSSAFTGDGALRNAYNGTAAPIEGAPSITGSSIIHMRVTVDLDADTYEVAYAVDSGAWYAIETGTHSGDINRLRLATATIGAGDIILVEHFEAKGNGTVPEPTWNGYAIQENDWVDTEGWMGWLNIANDPWIWNDSLQAYIYMPDGTGWAYVFN